MNHAPAIMTKPLKYAWMILSCLLFGMSVVFAEEVTGQFTNRPVAGSTNWSDPEVEAYLREMGARPGVQTKGVPTFGLFGDISYTDAGGGDNDKFTIGQLVLHGLSDFNNGFGGFFEVTVNSDPEWETRVERLQLFWEKNDNLKLSLGRFHVPVTWWNSTFHHGLWLQTTTRRPMMIGYDNAFIPNHAIGLIAEGLVPGLEDVGLRYIAGISGGDDDSRHTHDPQVATMPHEDEAMEGEDHAGHDHSLHTGPEDHRISPLGGLLYCPPSLPKLQVGSVAYSEQYTWDGEYDVDQLAIGAHAVYTSERPELILEYVRNVHEISGHDETFYSWSAYAQFAWRLARTGTAAKFKPYARVERIEIDKADPMFEDKNSADRVLGGIRVDFTTHVAVKLEYIRTEPDDADASREAMVQAVFKW